MKRKLHGLAQASLLASTFGTATVLAQSAATSTAESQELEEIIVRGVRGAQEAAIDIKRSSVEIVDAIVAEDVGKLPDVTITDALQRVTGIQIARDAGEGSFVSIRGAPQVMATMNGERFVTAENILDSTVSFEDIPASLITGVNVYKSQHAGLTDGGLGGLLDLQSIRALNLDEGMTLNASVQAGWGSMVDGTDEKYEALLGYKWNERVAMSLAASFSDSTAASSFQQSEFDVVDEFSTWIGNGTAPGDLNGDGDANDEFLIPLGWNSFVNSREFDRERLGLAYNFNAQLSDSFELIADVFYNEMEEGQHGQQLFFNGNFGGRGIFGPYSQATGRPSILGSFPTNDLIDRANVATEFVGYTNGLRGGVQSVLRDTDALNTNLELRFDNGGKLSGSLRWVHADAERTQKALTVAQQTDTNALSDAAVERLGVSDGTCVPRSQAQVDAGTCTVVNPNAIPTSGLFEVGGRLSSDQFSYIMGDQLRALASNPAAWRVHSSWLERNVSETEMNVLRADGRLELVDGFSLDFGLRYSDREMNEERADYFSPSGYPGLLSKYQEIGYGLNQNTGTSAGLTFDPLPVYTLDSPTMAPFLTTVTDFNVKGLVTGFPFVNSRALESPEAWRDALYGAGQYIAAPDRTYGVEEKQTSVYFKMNFDTPLGEVARMSGNVGIRVVDTEVTVFQNATDGTQLDSRILMGADPNHGAYLDLGDVYTTTDRTRALPSLNLNFDLNDYWRIKAAYYETQALQPLQNLGRGPITFYRGEDLVAGEGFQRVDSIQRLGNPRLEPWLARSFSAGVEWYPRDNTIVFAGAFYTDVDSYTYTQFGVDENAPDSDGVVRDGAQTQDIAQGEGASYYGFELGYQATFDFLPGFLSNMGTTLNYTYTPSQAGQDAATGEKILLADGSEAPFNNTAENQFNIVLFYQDARFQARIAANYLSKQYQGAVTHWSFAADNAGLAQYQEATLYLDAGASFDVTEALQVFVQGSNLTEEAPVNYVQWSDNRTIWNQFERVISAGVRARF